ncbi:hypothetical protein BV22DRAFT_1104899 [Leucogyrophana mollusca]|uniref:Uncharacterized protein n=1 Tax=Leucogyrophana mollusca TaxID=85980 RepID=A0ACB8BI49_9AGAM|nr:hypothetical protein BV22DRAFT_1104899 [Leucogyrophana mollusca]
METSVRKAPWSVRSNKIGKGPPPTPVPLPSQMLAWNQNTSNAGPSRAVPESPRRPRFGDIPRIDRSKKLPNPDSRNMPTGFQATTFPSSPSRSQNAKGKGTANAIFGAASQSRVASAFESGSQIFNGGPHPPSPPSSPIRGAFRSVQSGDNVTTVSEDAQYFDDNPEPNADVEMTDGTQPPFIATPFEEEIEEVEPRIWSIDLHRSIMTHIAPDRKSSTFQVLMRAPAPSQCAEKYSLSSAQLLEVLSGTPHSDYDWDYTIGTVCQSLVQMAQVLSISSSIPELSALFSLLAHLTYTIPAFHSVLLSPCEPSQGEKASPQILLILCAVIREKFVDIKEGHEETTGLASLVKETLGFLESMCWNLPDELENQLALIPRSPTILAILLDGSRPQWMLGRSTRLLVWFSTRRGLFRSLLSFPEPETPIPEKKPVDFTRLPHIETLCSHLADTSRIGPDADSMKTFILAFFAMLSVSHPDALTILVESQAVIPSLVLYLTHLSMILWEDDQMLMASPSTASSLIRSMNQTLCLFHHLIFHAESMPNLRERLEIAPARQYNGLIHMFIVTIGRMSYAEPPEWVNARDKLELEQLSDLARELLEEVVEGPEGDSIWATYQEDPDRKSDVVMDDDEEAEARRLDANVL